jgi:hypothetical protein
MTAKQIIEQTAADNGWEAESSIGGNEMRFRRGSLVALVGFTKADTVQDARLISVGPSGLLGDLEAKVVAAALRDRRAIVLQWLTVAV